MTTKEKLKKQIDKLPEEALLQIEKYIKAIMKQSGNGRKIKTLHLKGTYDKAESIRQRAYE